MGQLIWSALLHLLKHLWVHGVFSSPTTSELAHECAFEGIGRSLGKQQLEWHPGSLGALNYRGPPITSATFHWSHHVHVAKPKNQAVKVIGTVGVNN